MTQLNKQSSARARRCARVLSEVLDHRFFKALCEPGRLDILVRLAQCRRPCSVSEIARCCTVDLSVVSRHLALLRDAGVLQCHRQGKEVYYSVDCARLGGTLRAMAQAVERCCPPTSRRSRSRT